MLFDVIVSCVWFIVFCICINNIVCKVYINKDLAQKIRVHTYLIRTLLYVWMLLSESSYATCCIHSIVWFHNFTAIDFLCEYIQVINKLYNNW